MGLKLADDQGSFHIGEELKGTSDVEFSICWSQSTSDHRRS